MEAVTHLLNAIQIMERDVRAYSMNDVEMLNIVIRDCLREALIDVIEHAKKKVQHHDNQDADDNDKEETNDFWMTCIDQLFHTCSLIILNTNKMVPSVSKNMIFCMLDSCYGSGNKQCMIVFEKWLMSMKLSSSCLTITEIQNCIMHVEVHWTKGEEYQIDMLNCLKKVMLCMNEK